MKELCICGGLVRGRKDTGTFLLSVKYYNL